MAEKMNKYITVGSRKSELAMKQTNLIIGLLKDLYPEKTFSIETMETLGDKVLDKELSKIGSKSLFTKELEVALEEDQVDIVVHSLKDLPTTLPDGLVIGAISKREDPSDAIIMHPKFKDKKLKDLPKNSVIGTSSLRRIAQLKINYSHLKFANIRGNLNTRLAKLEDGNTYAGIILAVAGVTRMGWEEKISQYLLPSEFLYAVGQGALAVECRECDDNIIRLLRPLTDPTTLYATIAERAFMRRLEGGCSVPLGVHCEVNTTSISLKGGVWSLDGKEEIISQLSSSLTDEDNGNCKNDEPPKKRVKNEINYCSINVPDKYGDCATICYNLGVNLANKLIEQGAKRVLDEIKKQKTSDSNEK